MDKIREIEAQRESLLAEMRAIRSLRKGNISEQYLKVRHQNQKEPVLRGPYYTLTYKMGQKTVGYRLTTPAELEQAQQDLAAHRRFVELCREYEQLTERLGQLQRAQDEPTPEKKRRRSPSSRTGK